MPRNLRTKLAAIVNDAYDLRQEEVITRLERLFQDELEMKDAERIITYHDLTVIQSYAVNEYNRIYPTNEGVGPKLAGDHTNLRTLAMIYAVNAFMRSKGFTNTLFVYDKK